jgi:hypothetical protein
MSQLFGCQICQEAYNLKMPTPFYHLSVAGELLQNPGLPVKVREVLLQQRGAFLFGNTAPDVQVVSRQAREQTHFFDLPIRPGAPPAWELMLELHPSVGNPGKLLPAQAAFLAGYACHLQADWFWVLEVFMPVFGLRANWETFARRLYLHNVLRSYLDREILAGLQDGTGAELSQVQPDGWLPFVQDMYLVEWRDFLAAQLQPGAEIRTVEVFAQRQGVSPQEYYRLLDSQAEMDAEIFSRLPRHALDAYRQRLVQHNLAFLRDYLAAPEAASIAETR